MGYYQDHKEQLKAYARQYKIKMRTLAYEMLGGACKYCGEDDPIVLEIDHVKNDGKLDRTNKRGPDDMYRNIVSGRRATDDLQLVCANCHRRQSHYRNAQRE